MNPFRDYTVSWKEVAVLKLALLALGLAIGSYWADLFLPYFTWLLGIGLVLGIFSAFRWFSK